MIALVSSSLEYKLGDPCKSDPICLSTYIYIKQKSFGITEKGGKGNNRERERNKLTATKHHGTRRYYARDTFGRTQGKY